MIELNNIYPGGTALFLIQAADAYSSHDQQLTQRLHSKAKGKAKQHQQSQQLPVRSESVALPRQLEGPKLSSPTQGMHEVTTQNETDPTWTIRDLAVLEDLASQELVL